MPRPSVMPKPVVVSSMAQDSNARPVRSDESQSREAAAAGRNNDPLAELARLIGQDDPFALGRQGAGASARGTPSEAHADPHAPEWLDRRAPAPQQDHYDDADQHDAAAYDAQHGHDQHHDQAQYADEYYDDGQTYADEGYEEPAPQKRRGGMTIVAAVVGLAVLGTAGVYGYRAFSGPSGTSGEPPVIKAEQTPMKVVPPAPTNDMQAPKAFVPGADRGTERMVPREEQPV